MRNLGVEITSDVKFSTHASIVSAKLWELLITFSEFSLYRNRDFFRNMYEVFASEDLGGVLVAVISSARLFQH